jgi:hypothetical protein
VGQRVVRRSELEAEFALQIKMFKPDVPQNYVEEFEFAEDIDRKWRFDFAWPELMVAVECEGLSKGKSRHLTIKGFIDDCEKYAEATARGWLVLRVTRDQIRDLSAMRWLQRAIGIRQGRGKVSNQSGQSGAGVPTT